ncbi:hypothetical protein [Cumulibacter soli]|uniref:hypothetical protein n=1 Tax=Cumulibacter soli TaxID=2546344 RepID=UPI0010688A20|nr:hypothetical protein [Cumulibacter soli]
MIDIDDVLAESVGGSVTHAVQATAWRDGDLTFPLPEHIESRLEVVSWRTSEDATESARTCEVTVASQDERLLPRSLDAILGPYGAEINLSSGVDLGPELGERLQSEGWFRIDTASGKRYDEYYRDTDQWVNLGVTVRCTGIDRMSVLEAARFEQTITTVQGTVHSAIAALCDELVPVGVHQVADASIPKIVLDSDDRVEAIDTLAKRIEARAVFDREGQLILKPRSAGTGTWDLPDWSLLALDEELTADEFYNAVIVIGRDPSTQEEVRGAYYEPHGPTAYRSGLKKPYFHSSPLMTTVAQCNAAARTTFETVVRRRQSVARIEVPPHQGVESLDDVLIRVGGDVLVGSVKRVERSGGSGDSTMKLDVWLPLEDSRRLQ